MLSLSAPRISLARIVRGDTALTYTIVGIRHNRSFDAHFLQLLYCPKLCQYAHGRISLYGVVLTDRFHIIELPVPLFAFEAMEKGWSEGGHGSLQIYQEIHIGL